LRSIPAEEVRRRLQVENPWWTPPHRISASFFDWRPRAYFQLFLPLVEQVSIRRAILLMGPRRVGKTVLIHHAIQALIDSGANPRDICYVSVDHPLYNGCGLEELVGHFDASAGGSGKQRYVFFDEIQYLRDWETHLKVLVDSRPDIKFVASGSAAAALRLKSSESGAGRFTDFLLPPLTFHEYLDLLQLTHLAGSQVETEDGWRFRQVPDIAALTSAFVHYLNFGGYPEVIFSPEIQADPGRFIKSDIVDKVLLRDLPGLYGIQDIQELNHLFTTLAYNTAQEVSLEQLSQSSGVAKNTIKRYIEYLEAAFLIRVVHRIDRNGKRFQRANFFKVYLTNPSIRAALFSPIGAEHEAMGSLAETGVFSQWFHSPFAPYYARWNKGEVDIVGLGERQKPTWAVEVKWSDRYPEHPRELGSLLDFCSVNKMTKVTVTTRSVTRISPLDQLNVLFIPASVYCYTVGFNVVRGKHMKANLADAVEDARDDAQPLPLDHA
jgi:predicted AAA+ superfamily ATPase